MDAIMSIVPIRSLRNSMAILIRKGQIQTNKEDKFEKENNG